MNYSLNKLRKMLLTHNIDIYRCFVYKGYCRVLELHVPRSGSYFLVYIPSSYKIKPKDDKCIVLHKVDVEHVSPSYKTFVPSQREVGVGEVGVTDKNIIDELRVELKNQTSYKPNKILKNPHSLPVEPGKVSVELDSLTEEVGAELVNTKLPEYDDFAYTEIIDGDEYLTSTVSKAYEPAIDSPIKISTQKIHNQLSRFSKIVRSVGCTITIINTNYLVIDNSKLINCYTFTPRYREYTMYITINLQKLIKDVNSLYVEIPVLATRIQSMIRRCITVHNKTVLSHSAYSKYFTDNTLYKLLRKEKSIQNTIGKFRELLIKLTKYEDSLKRKIDIYTTKHLKMSNEFSKIVVDTHHELDRIINMQRSVSNNIVSLDKDINNIFIESDDILHDNIIIYHIYIRNQKRLKQIISGT